MLRTLILASLLLAGLGLGPARAQDMIDQRGERLGTIDTLMQNFRIMAFEGGANFYRWRVPVRVTLIGEAAETYRGEVRGLLGEFSMLTGISFRLTEDADEANMQIFFSERAYFQSAAALAFARPQNVLCFTSTRSDGAGGITVAVTVIPEDLTPRASRSCLAHELMHAIGFRGHPINTFDSALRNGIAAVRLTTNDRILIRALYDPALRPGGNSQNILAAATTIVRNLLGEVQEATDPLDVLAMRTYEEPPAVAVVVPVVLPPKDPLSKDAP